MFEGAPNAVVNATNAMVDTTTALVGTTRPARRPVAVSWWAKHARAAFDHHLATPAHLSIAANAAMTSPALQFFRESNAPPPFILWHNDAGDGTVIEYKQV
jgi:hypothetical protein